MGESSAPRRPTHDTSTSRREVKRSEYAHTHDNNNNNNTSSKQTQTYHEVNWIDCIYFDASCFCYGFNSFCIVDLKPTCLLTTSFGDAIRVDGELMHGDIRDNKCCWYGELVHESQCYQNTPIEPTPKPCCRANTLECQACIADVSEEEFCRRDPHSHVCPQKPDNKPSHPDNCYSSIWNTEIRHGEMGAKKCCWYGKWEKKSKCEKNPPVTHPDNCYSSIWNTEIRHGEMGARK